MVLGHKRWRNLALICLVFLLPYAITRLVNLTLLPIFTDEAIYIRWAQIGSRDASWRFISLVDGKQPLFTWILMAVLKVVHEPLFAGRLVSVGAGLFSMIGVWLLGRELFASEGVAFTASALYLFSPFALMYDRMALYDSLVATFYVWNLYIAILLVKTLRLDVSLILGLTLGLGMLNKSIGFLSLYLLPVSLLLFDWSHKKTTERFIRWVGLVVVSALISQALYSVLRLSPLFHMISQKDAVFVYPFHEWINHPANFFYGNIKGLFDWLYHYETLPIFVLSFIPILTLWSRGRKKLLLYLWWLLPFAALASFGRVLYPRFILFMTMPLLVLAALPVNFIYKKLGKTIPGVMLLTIIFFWSLVIDYFIITNPTYAQIPDADRGQYIDNWPAGGGVKEIISYLSERVNKYGKVSVYTEGTFGLFPYALEIYLVDNPRIKIRGIWPLPPYMPQEMLDDARDHETYFILNQSQAPPLGWQLELIAHYQKGNRKDRELRFYKVLPSLTMQYEK